MQAFNLSAAAPTGATFVALDITSTCKELTSVLDTVKDPAIRRALTTKLLLLPAPQQDVKRKAVNCFVGFRCHYTKIPALKGYPMKVMSGVLGDLWHQDLNQSLWTLIAQAWTTIRDEVGDNKARRDEFFNVLFDHLPIPSPATYLEDHGLSVKMNEAGVLTLERLPHPPLVQSLVSAGLVSPTLSAEDLVAFAQCHGYALGYKPDMNASSGTFLGRSVQQRNKSFQVPAYATFPDPKIRVTKNKKRRFELQTRTTASNLRAEINNVHMAESSNEAPADDVTAVSSGRDEFYYGIATFAVNTMLSPKTDTASPLHHVAPEPMVTYTNNTILPNWNPFSLGADPDATLPSFDESFA